MDPLRLARFADAYTQEREKPLPRRGFVVYEKYGDGSSTRKRFEPVQLSLCRLRPSLSPAGASPASVSCAFRPSPMIRAYAGKAIS
jgi:hypothetical protein